MSDAIAIVGPLVPILTQAASDNAEVIAGLAVALLLALLDGLRKTGPFSSRPWLINLIRLGIPAAGRALAAKLKRKGGK